MSTEVSTLPDQQEATGLVQLAIERGVPVEVLERLVALKERMAERDARGAFFQALADFHAEVGPIPKTAAITVTRAGTQEVRSRYAPLDKIVAHVRPLLQRHGFIFHWNSTLRENGNVCITCHLRHVDGHSESADFEFPQKEAGAPGMNGVQIAGSARTYGERYSLIQVLGLTTADEDTDGAAPNEFITREQVSELDVKIQTTHTDKDRFLAWLGVAQLSEIPQRDYRKAMQALDTKAEQNKARQV